MTTPEAKRAIATQACKALRELDKVSWIGSGAPEFDELRRQILKTIDDCGYTVRGEPWKIERKE